MDRNDRLSIDHCSQVLNKPGKPQRTPEQVKAMRDFLYTLALIEKQSLNQKTNEERH